MGESPAVAVAASARQVPWAGLVALGRRGLGGSARGCGCTLGTAATPVSPTCAGLSPRVRCREGACLCLASHPSWMLLGRVETRL